MTTEDVVPDGVADRIEDLGDEIAALAAHLHAATHRLLLLIAEFDGLRGWEQGGFRSCAHWLAFRTGIDLGAAREKVRAARSLESLPDTSAAMARGELSFAKVRALTRVATADNEAQLLELARSGTAAQPERGCAVGRSWAERTKRRPSAGVTRAGRSPSSPTRMGCTWCAADSIPRSRPWSCARSRLRRTASSGARRRTPRPSSVGRTL